MPDESEGESVRIKREPYGLWLQQYEEVGMLIEDRVAVKRDEKWGFIDETGQEIIPLIYYEVGDFKERWFKNSYYEVLAEVSMTRGMWGDYGFINLRGDIVIPIIYKKMNYLHRSDEIPKALATYLEAKSPFTLLNKSCYHLFFSRKDLSRKFVSHKDLSREEQIF